MREMNAVTDYMRNADQYKKRLLSRPDPTAALVELIEFVEKLAGEVSALRSEVEQLRKF